VDTEKVSAEYKDGVLKITLPKLQKDQPQKRIEIKG
jgi:HSP20 family molecular chaperone IbpA